MLKEKIYERVRPSNILCSLYARGGFGNSGFCGLEWKSWSKTSKSGTGCNYCIVACLGVMLLSGKIPNLVVESSIPFYSYLGGLFVVFYVLGMTWIAPKFGVGNAVAFVLLGQIISMAIIDHFSLLGAAYHPISAQRFVGIALMAIGVFMSVRG